MIRHRFSTIKLTGACEPMQTHRLQVSPNIGDSPQFIAKDTIVFCAHTQQFLVLSVEKCALLYVLVAGWTYKHVMQCCIQQYAAVQLVWVYSHICCKWKKFTYPWTFLPPKFGLQKQPLCAPSTKFFLWNVTTGSERVLQLDQRESCREIRVC